MLALISHTLAKSMCPPHTKCTHSCNMHMFSHILEKIMLAPVDPIMAPITAINFYDIDDWLSGNDNNQHYGDINNNYKENDANIDTYSTSLYYQAHSNATLHRRHQNGTIPLQPHN